MHYQCPEEFDFAQFVTDCNTAGVTLEKTDAVPEPDGHATMHGHCLRVALYTPNETKEAAIDAAADAQGATPH